MPAAVKITARNTAYETSRGYYHGAKRYIYPAVNTTSPSCTENAYQRGSGKFMSYFNATNTVCCAGRPSHMEVERTQTSCT
jgi:hypothetical protein